MLESAKFNNSVVPAWRDHSRGKIPDSSALVPLPSCEVVLWKTTTYRNKATMLKGSLTLDYVLYIVFLEVNLRLHQLARMLNWFC